jgi:hypothetical protein
MNNRIKTTMGYGGGTQATFYCCYNKGENQSIFYHSYIYYKVLFFMCVIHPGSIVDFPATCTGGLHPAFPEWHVIEKIGKDKRCSSWRDNPGKIVKFADTWIGSSQIQVISHYFICKRY